MNCIVTADNCVLEIVWSNWRGNEREKSESSRRNKGSKRNGKGELKRDVRNGKPGEKVSVCTDVVWA